MEPIIKVENLGKSYIIGHQRERYVALRDVLTNKARQVASKTKNLFSGGQLIAGNELEEFWALKDINFEVQQGDRVGIIGRNGAGKSTLLKVLSRITEPTTGKIHLKGRVASLLEVGTGFHPELSGRENIYLNGAILGMSRTEVKKKFDEIVDFAGVEKFLDTPVKRYSSGMYVRLAFAVAAHLEPEILIVDEVLAVGDAEFQKKCLGKMEDVSKQDGRTVLFVSHNMAAIQNLCNKGILLKGGYIEMTGNTIDAINKYVSGNNTQKQKLSDITNRKGNGTIVFSEGYIKDNSIDILNQVESFSEIQIELKFKTLTKLDNIFSVRIDIGINNTWGDRIAWLSTENINGNIDLKKEAVTFKINNLPLAPGDYNCNLYCEINKDVSDWLINVLPFTVVEKDYYGTGKIVPTNQGNIILNYTLC